VGFLAITSAIIIIKAPDNSLQIFNPFAWNSVYGSLFNKIGGPIAGLGLGMIFGLTSFIGYGGSAPLGEEVKRSKDITKALMLGVTIVGVVLTEVSYALTVGWGTNNMLSFSLSAIPGIIVYARYLTIAGGLLLALFAFNSAFSDSVAMQSNAGRVYFAMGREGLLPKFFAEINEKWITPAKSLAFIGVMSSILAILSGFVIGYFSGLSPLQMVTLPATSPSVINALENSFDFLTTIALVGFIVAHFINNSAVMVFFHRNKSSEKNRHDIIHLVIHYFLHYFLPALATVIFAFVLYESIIPPVFPVTQAVLFGSAILIFSVIYTIWIKIKKQEIYANIGKSVNVVEEERKERLQSR
ncbi:APC family permease, partial [Acidianus sp. RZ1]